MRKRVIALLQRVLEASVTAGDHVVAAIGPGLVAFVGFEPGDDMEDGTRLVDRLLDYPLFGDDREPGAPSLRDTHGGLLLVPQATLTLAKAFSGEAAAAAPHPESRLLFERMAAYARGQHTGTLETGRLGVRMRIHLIHDGPAVGIMREHARSLQADARTILPNDALLLPAEGPGRRRAGGDPNSAR